MFKRALTSCAARRACSRRLGGSPSLRVAVRSFGLTSPPPSSSLPFAQDPYFEKTRREISEAHTINPDLYTSPDAAEHERKAVFEKSWTCVGFASDVPEPGDVRTVEVGTQPLILTRTKKGEIKCFKNVCRHRGNRLVYQDGRYPVMVCKYHRWGYALDGRLMATPLFTSEEGGKKKKKAEREAKKARGEALDDEPKRMSRAERRRLEKVAEIEAAEAGAEEAYKKSGPPGGGGCADCGAELTPAQELERKNMDMGHVKGFDKKDFALFPVRMERLGHMLFVNVDGEAPPLYEYLGCAAEQISQHDAMLRRMEEGEVVSVKKKMYGSRANWKILMENFMEYYHLPSVHPSLCAVSAVDDHKRTQGPGMNTSFVTHPISAGGTPREF